MSRVNTGLKLLFLFSAFLFIFVFTSAPKTDCQACKIGYERRIIDGHEAYKIFEEACISYDKPWNDLGENVTLITEKDYNVDKKSVYVDLDNINITEENGIQQLSWKKENELTKEEAGLE